MRESAEPIVDKNQAASQIRKAFHDCDAQERFVAMYLNAKNHPIGFHEIAKGGYAEVGVDIRAVLVGALLSGARAMIVAHNHPSCDVRPSREDQTLTNTLGEAGSVIGVQVLDHLVMCNSPDGKVFSFAESGNLRGLEGYAIPEEKGAVALSGASVPPRRKRKRRGT